MLRLSSLGLVVAIATLAPPAPDRAALNDIVGTWQSDTVAGTSGISVCAPSPSGAAVICEQSISSPRGERTAVNLYMVDSAANRYAYYGINDVGIVLRPTVLRIANHVWTYGGDTPGSDGVFVRTINDFTAGTTYTWRTETSRNGVQWTVVRGGRSRRQSR